MINSQFRICNLTKGYTARVHRDSMSSEGERVWTPSLCTSESESSYSDSDESIAQVQLSLDRSVKNILTCCDTNEKPSHSYTALISMAILSKSKKKLLLNDIYQYIMDTFPFYNNKEKAWRNNVRYNLSLNECFMKNGRSDKGKGNYWSIHLAYIEDFAKGDFSRRQVRRRVRKSSVKTVNGSLDVNNVQQKLGYVPMTSSQIGFNPYSMKGFNPYSMKGFNSYSMKGFPMHTYFENQYQNYQSPVSTLRMTRTQFPVEMQSFGSNSSFPVAPSAGRLLHMPSTYCLSSSFSPNTNSAFYPSCHIQKGISDW